MSQDVQQLLTPQDPFKSHDALSYDEGNNEQQLLRYDDHEGNDGDGYEYTTRGRDDEGSRVAVHHGNELSLFEKRRKPLMYMQPYFCPTTTQITKIRTEMEPIRLSEEALKVRSDEVFGHAQRRLKDVRRLRHEFTERIKEVLERQHLEEMERSKRPKDRMRWWHRKTAPELRDPLKLARFNNLSLTPEYLLQTKDVVILNLTGVRLGDEAMTWVGAFVQQSYTLRRLILQGNYLTAEGCRELYLGFRNTKTLVDIDLSLNPIGDEGAEVVSNALVENTRACKVYKLNVSTCNLSSSAGYHLSRLIRESRSLTCLLAWRNRLGVGKGAKQSGAAMIFEELRGNTRMRLVDLSANNITDRDASDHAQMHETEARKRALMEIEKRAGIARLEELRGEIKEKRRAAVFDDEKVAIGKLEREAEQIKAKIRMAKELEARRRTYDQKKELEHRERVKQHTGTDLVEPTYKIRLILTGNHSIMPQTLKRLAAFYDVAKEPDYSAFVQRPRRFDRIVAPRRAPGDEYTPRDVDAFDSHNVLPWDHSDPDVEFRRRQALLQWREEERIKEEQLRPAHFEKFRFQAPAQPPPGASKNAKVVAGIGVASGVNARIRMTREDEKPRPLPKPAVRTVTTTDDAAGASKVVKVLEPEIDPDLPPEVIRVPRQAKDQPEQGGEHAAVHQPSAAAVAEAIETAVSDDASSSAADSDGDERGDGFWDGGAAKGERYEQLLPESARRGDSDEETDDDDDDNENDDDNIEAFEDSEWEVQELDEQQWMQEKLRQRTEEIRNLVNARAQVIRATPRGGDAAAAGSQLSSPRGLAASVSSAGVPLLARASSNVSAGGLASAREQSASGGAAPAPLPQADDATTGVEGGGGGAAVPALQLSAGGAAAAAGEVLSPAAQLIFAAIEDIAGRRQEILFLGEIGSPSDSDIRRREEAVAELGEVKRRAAAALLAADGPCEISPMRVDALADFIESLVVESDLTPGNAELLDALMAMTQIDFPGLIRERGLATTAAIDGSMTFLDVMLAAPILEGEELMELIFACVFNQTSRVPLARLLLEKNIDFAPIFDDVMPVMQEFFEDVASARRAIPKEDRSGVKELLRDLVAHPVLGPHLVFEAEGADGQTAFTRACYEGNLDLVGLMLSTGRVSAINMIKSDGTTPLMQAVFSNVPAVVGRLLDVPGIDVGIAHPENGNALDIAVGLQRDPQIAALLKEKGAKPSGGARATAKVPAKKTVKVKVAVPRGPTAGAPHNKKAVPKPAAKGGPAALKKASKK